MENVKISRKALRSLVSDSMREAISKLDLPKSNKKVKKLIDKSSKKIASEFSQVLKKERKKNKKIEKSLTYVEDVLTGKDKKGKKNKKQKEVKLQKQVQPEIANI